MASLEEIAKKIEQQRLQKLEEERILEYKKYEELEKQRLFMMQEMNYYQSLHERIAVSTSVSSASAGGNKIPTYFTIDVTPQSDGDNISFYILSPSAVTYDWGDGTIDDNDNHTYTTAGSYQIKISPINITELQIVSMSDGIYSGPKFSEFLNLTKLVALWILTVGSTIENGALDNCKKLEMLAFKFGGPSQLKKSMFNNLTSLTDFGIIYGNTINSFESGIFEGTSIENIYIYGTPFTSTTLVDQFLIDLNNSILPNLKYITTYTHRTTNSDVAVSGLTEKGVEVDIVVDLSPLLITAYSDMDFNFNATLAYSSQGNVMHVDWGDGTSEDYNNDSKKKGGWAYFTSHSYATGGTYNITINTPSEDALYFYIDGRYISNITFPSLTSLETLYLENLQISDINLSPLTGLLYLYLDDGNFTRIPNLSNLSKLKELNMSANPLSGTLSFSGLSNLQYLDISNSQITSLDGSDFSDLINLLQLNINSNRISNIPTGIFSHLSSLTYLDFEYNSITNLQSNVFSGLTSLTDIVGDNNIISNIEIGAFNGLNSIENINLANNQLSGLTYGIFSGLTNFSGMLYLVNNYISSLPDDIFEDLISLKYLYLNNNRISSLQNGLFDGLNDLIDLAFDNNQIVTLPNFNKMSSLININFQQNLITGITSNTFTNISSAIHIALTNNNISFIDTNSFINNTGLTTLDLSRNKLTSSGLVDGSFYGLNNLEYLYLYYNNLQGIDPMVFQGVNAQSNINLYSCYLTTTDVDNLLIRFNNTGRNHCTLDFHDESRTHDSDDAINNLVTTWSCTVYCNIG